MYPALTVSNYRDLNSHKIQMLVNDEWKYIIGKFVYNFHCRRHYYHHHLRRRQ